MTRGSRMTAGDSLPDGRPVTSAGRRLTAIADEAVLGVFTPAGIGVAKQNRHPYRTRYRTRAGLARLWPR